MDGFPLPKCGIVFYQEKPTLQEKKEEETMKNWKVQRKGEGRKTSKEKCAFFTRLKANFSGAPHLH